MFSAIDVVSPSGLVLSLDYYQSLNLQNQCWVKYTLRYQNLIITEWSEVPQATGRLYENEILLYWECSSVQVQRVNNKQWTDLTLSGFLSLPQFNNINISRTFRVYSDYPFVKLDGMMSVDNDFQSNITLNLTKAEILHLIVPAERNSSYGLPTVLTVSQWNGYMTFWPNPTGMAPFSKIPFALNSARASIQLHMGSVASYDTPYISSEGWFAVASPNPHRNNSNSSFVGLVCMIDFNGKSTLSMNFIEEDQSCNFMSNIDNLFHPFPKPEWKQTQFEWPGVWLGAYTYTPTQGTPLLGNDEQDDEAAFAIQQFSEAHIYPSIPNEDYPWVQYDSWNYERDINETNQLEALHVASDIGIEAFILDLGWSTFIGDWVADPIKFPNGLKPLSDAAHSVGIKFGLHLPLSQMFSECPIAVKHPEWLVDTYNNDYQGASPLCLANIETSEWLLDSILWLIDNYGVDYFVQDGEDMVKECHHKDHTHHPYDSNYANSIALDNIWKKVKEQRPNIVLENCEDGGSMLTYRMASIFTTSISVDNTGSYMTRQGIYGHSYGFSPRFSARYIETIPSGYTFHSGMFGGPLILQQRFSEYTPKQIDIAKQSVDLYKSLRPFIRRGKVIHLAAPVQGLMQGFYDTEDGVGWDAIQSLDSIAGDWSIIFVFRALLGNPTFTVYPRGLADTATYIIQFVNNPKQNLTLSGDSIMRQGINVTLEESSSEILLLHVITKTRPQFIQANINKKIL